MTSIIPTFYSLDPVLPTPPNPRVVDITNKPTSAVVRPRGSESFEYKQFPSRVKKGITVSASLTKCQTQRVPLSPSDVKFVEEIYDSIISLKTSHTNTVSDLFGVPFNITLTKNDSAYGKPSPHLKDKTKTKENQKTTSNTNAILDTPQKSAKKPSKEETMLKGDKEKKEPEDHPFLQKKTKPSKRAKTGVGGLDDLVNSIKLDTMTREVIKKWWLSNLRLMEMYRIKFGVCPFYFVQIEESVSTYSPVPKRRRTKRNNHFEGAGGSTNDDDDDYDDDDVDDYNYSDSESNQKVKQQGKNDRHEKNDISTHPMAYKAEGFTNQHWTEGDTTSDNVHNTYSGTGDLQKEILKSKTILTKGQKNKEIQKLMVGYGTEGEIPAYGKQAAKLSNTLKRIGEESVGYATYEGAEDMLGIPLPKSTSRHHIPYANQVYDEVNNVEEGMGAQVSKLSQKCATGSDSMQSQGGEISYGLDPNVYINGYPSGKIQERKVADAMLSAKSDMLEWNDEKKMRELQETQNKNSWDKSMPPPSISPGKMNNASNPYSKSGEGYPATEESDNNNKVPAERKRKRVVYESESTPSANGRSYRVKKIETKITHNVPIVPPIETGTIEVYHDLDGIKYFWTWKGKDEFSGKVEPFMMWVSFNPPSADGKLTSQVSSMIGDYEDYQTAKKEFDFSAKAAENPFYVVEIMEPKASQPGNNLLVGENYVPMLGATGQGASQFGGPTLELDDHAIQSRNREALLRGGNIPMRPRGYLQEDGANNAPGWDYGRLVDRNSDVYRSSMPHVAAARMLNGQLGMGPAAYQYGPSAGTYNHQRAAQLAYQQTVGLLSHRATRRSTYDNYEKQEHIINYNMHTQQANSTGNLLNRRTMFTPQGNFMFLQTNEKITKMDAPVAGNAATVTAYKDKLEQMGSILGGAPNPMLLGQINSKGAGSDGIYTSKSSVNTRSSYGLSISSSSLSPNKEYAEKAARELKGVYSDIIKTMFQLAYQDVFKSQETWYKEIIEQTFKEEIEKIQRKNTRRASKGKSPKQQTLPNLPEFESLFTVEITFPVSGSSVGLPRALDLYKLGFFEAEDVMHQMEAEVHTGTVRCEDYLQMITDNNSKSSKTYANRLIRLQKGLEEALQYEKTVDLKPVSESGPKKSTSGSSGTKNKKAKAKTKVSPEKKAKIKAKAKAKVKAKQKNKATKKGGQEPTKSTKKSKTNTTTTTTK